MTALPAGTVARGLADGGPQAVLRLARASRGPIVELAAGSPPGPAAPDGYDVTFVYSGHRQQPAQVGLFCPALPGGFARLGALGEQVFAGTFRLPGQARVTYHFCLDPPGQLDQQALAALARSPAGRQLDRLNPGFDEVHLRGLRLRVLESLLALPAAPAAPATRPRPGVPAGRIEELPIQSRALGRRKDVVLYRPAAGGPGPVVLLLQSNEEWRKACFLDNLSAWPGLPPFTAVLFTERSFTASLHDFGRGTAYTRFVVDELWPALAGRGVTPGRAAVAGYSAAGAAAVSLAVDEPSLFPRLAVISGALRLGPQMDIRATAPRPPELLRRISQASAGPERAYLAAGWYEDASSPAIREDTAALAALLRGRGSAVRLDIGPSSHDTVSARAYLAAGLGWLLA